MPLNSQGFQTYLDSRSSLGVPERQSDVGAVDFKGSGEPELFVGFCFFNPGTENDRVIEHLANDELLGPQIVSSTNRGNTLPPTRI